MQGYNEKTCIATTAEAFISSAGDPETQLARTGVFLGQRDIYSFTLQISYKYLYFKLIWVIVLAALAQLNQLLSVFAARHGVSFINRGALAAFKSLLPRPTLSFFPNQF